MLRGKYKLKDFVNQNSCFYLLKRVFIQTDESYHRVAILYTIKIAMRSEFRSQKSIFLVEKSSIFYNKVVCDQVLLLY